MTALDVTEVLAGLPGWRRADDPRPAIATAVLTAPSISGAWSFSSASRTSAVTMKLPLFQR
ncbi:hypothetical protein D1872_327630 [compost metagenome]